MNSPGSFSRVVVLLAWCAMALCCAESAPANDRNSVVNSGIIEGDVGLKLDGEYLMSTARYGYRLRIQGSHFEFSDYYGHTAPLSDYEGMVAYANAGVLHIVIPRRRTVISLHAVRVAAAEWSLFLPIDLGRQVEDKSITYDANRNYVLSPNLNDRDAAIALQVSGRIQRK